MAILKEERIGGQRLILGDCMEVMPLLGDFDAIVTDPPYGIGISRNPVRQAHAAKEWDTMPIGADCIDLILGASKEQIIWGGNYFDLLPSRGFLIWDKLQPENFSLAMCEMAWCSMDMNAKIFKKSVTSYKKEHPTQKPTPLMEWCLGFLPDAATILDPFMGSGSTLIACHTQGRQGTGVERDSDYFEIACKRLDEAMRQPDMFAVSPAPEPTPETGDLF